VGAEAELPFGICLLRPDEAEEGADAAELGDEERQPGDLNELERSLDFLFGRWCVEDVLSLEAHLMYVPFGGGGYASLRPEDIAKLPLDELYWHTREVSRRREVEAEAMRSARGKGEPSRDSGATDDD
jgi:hypothetical protein